METRPTTKLRWSVRTLLLIVVAFSLFFGFIAYARSPQPIMLRLESVGGHVSSILDTHDWTLPMVALNAVFGPFERFSKINYIQIHSDDINDADLAAICAGGEIGAFELKSKSVTDRGISELRRCNTLTHLDLECPQVTDEGLRCLEVMFILHSLSVKSDKINGSCLEHVDRETRLLTLVLRGSQVDDRVCETAVEFDELSEILLPYTAVTDKGLLLLAEHRPLRSLSVIRSKVTPEGARRFSYLAPGVDFHSDH